MSDQELSRGDDDLPLDTGWYSPDNSTFGDRLAGAREACGLSRTDLAGKLGVMAETVAGWEDDRGEPRAARMTALARILDVSPGWLLSAQNDAPAGIDAAPPGGDGVAAALEEVRHLRADLARASERAALLETRLRRIVR